MKHLKMLGLAIAAALALTSLAGVGTASATALYSGAAKLGAGTEIVGTVSGSTSLVTTEGTVLLTCTSGSQSGKTTNNGGAAETIKESAGGIVMTNCTEPFTSLAGGTFEYHSTSGLNGTVTASGFDFTVNTTVFGSCVFTFPSGSVFGTVTGSSLTNAVLDTTAAVVRKSGLCPSSAKFVVTYKVTKPAPFHITAS